MSISRSRLLIELGTACVAERARRTLLPALTKSTRRFGVRLGPRPLDLTGRRSRWE
jgi:hypothetical protein